MDYTEQANWWKWNFKPQLYSFSYKEWLYCLTSWTQNKELQMECNNIWPLFCQADRVPWLGTETQCLCSKHKQSGQSACIETFNLFWKINFHQKEIKHKMKLWYEFHIIYIHYSDQRIQRYKHWSFSSIYEGHSIREVL